MQPLQFRVLTVNVHKGFSFFNRRFILSELREAVREVRADLVFLQEVLGEHSRHAARRADWPGEPQYEYLADALWDDTAYGRNAVYPHGHHGNALLSRFPIHHQVNHDASHPGDETRGLLHCVLSPDGRGAPEMHTICVHLGLRESHRQAQLRQLCEILEEIPADAPTIVAGDFNDWQLKGHQLLTDCIDLREAFVQDRGRPERTFPARWPLLRLDRIYTRGVRACRPVALPRRPWSHLSDHAPLAVEIEA